MAPRYSGTAVVLVSLLLAIASVGQASAQSAAAAAASSAPATNPFKFTELALALKAQFSTLSTEFSAQLGTQTAVLGSSITGLIFGPAYIAATATTAAIATVEEIKAQLSNAILTPPIYTPGVKVPAQCVGIQEVYTISGGSCVIESKEGPVVCTPPIITKVIKPAFCSLAFTSASVITDAQSTSVKTYGGVATSGTISGGNSTTFTIGKKTKVLSASVTSSPAAAPASSAAAAASASSSKPTKPSKPTKHHKHA